MTAAGAGGPDPTEPGPASRPDLVVAMLTYRRPDDLALAVPAFLAELPADAQLLVVDNDPDGSAAGVEDTDPRVRYVHEPRPGIAAARNRALDEAAGAQLLIFVDDDERPVPGWLSHLLATHAATGAGVVGPVVSEYAHEPDPWLAAGRFFDRRRLATGTPVTTAATNNLLLDLAAVADLRFDEAFGISGGSDTLFTRTLTGRGHRLVWCAEAVVVDAVPAERLTRAWVLRRARRLGNSAVRVNLVLAGSAPRRAVVRAAWLARGAGRIIVGGARHLLGRLTGDLGHDARGLRTVERGRGMVGGALGSVVYEYHRDGLGPGRSEPR